MKEIQLTKNKIAIVDDEDYEYLNQFKWTAQKGWSTWYAKRASKKDGRHNTILMHRSLLNVTDKSILVDHINQNGLDCRRSNLRLANKTQNSVNSKIRIDNSTGYKGVSYDEKRRSFYACIYISGKTKSLGRYKTAGEASEAYEAKAKELFGDFKD